MADTNCPYCDVEIEINHDDGYGYDEQGTHQQECDGCGKTFVYTTSISFNYYPEKADCLNGSEHDWKPTKTFPKEFTEMRCTMCDEKRKPTEVEMAKILTPLN